MASIQIPNLPAATALNGTEQMEAVQNGTSVRVTSAQIAGLTQNVGTVTQINTSGPIGGGPITTSGTISLQTQGVTNDYLAAAPSNTLKGNISGGASSPADLTVNQVMTLLGAAPLNSPAFTGTPTAPTPLTSDNSNQIATTAFVKAQGAGTGTVTNVATGTGLTGGPITTTGTISLANTAVTPGTYGSTNSSAVIAVDQQGRITSASSASITPGSIGAAANTILISSGSGLTGGGDLTANRTLSLAPITNNYLLANTSGGSAAPTGTTISSLLDSAISNTQGSFLYRNAAQWTVLLPGASGSFLTTGGAGSNPYWTAATGSGTVTSIDVSGGTTGLIFSGGPVTTSGTITMAGTLASANGGTGRTSLGTGVQTALGQAVTGTGGIVLANSPTIITANLDTPSYLVLTNATGLPLTTGVTGTLPIANGGTGITSFGTGVQAALGQNVTGSGGIVLATNASLTTPNLGTPSAAVLTNATGLSLTTGVTGVLPVLNGGTGVTTSTGSGSNVLSNSPTLTTPNLGTPSAVTLTNGTGLPLTSGVTGILPVANGGSGAVTLTGYVKGNGTSAFTAASTIPNTDITGLGTMSTQNANSVNISGGSATLTSIALTSGTISTTPSSSTDIVNKTYVDNALNNVNYHAAALWATTADLGSVTYNNGTSGVGATITNAGTQAALVIDGHTFTATDVTNAVRILVKNESNAAYNGVYTVTNQGSVLTNWVLTRATDFDQTGTGQNEIAPGDYVFVVNGTANANTAWIQATPLPITIGTTDITFIQVAGTGTYTAGTGLTLTANQFSITNTAVTATSYGSSTAIPSFTVNAQGQLTAASTNAVIAPAGTLTGTTLAANVVSSSLTSVGTIATGVWNGTTIGTGYGGTGLTTFTSGGAVYATSTSVLTTGTLPITAGGTGITAFGTGVQTALGQAVTGSGGIVLATSPTLITPNLGTPSAAVLTNATGLPLTTGVTGTLGTTNGGTGLTGFSAANNAIYSTSSSALTAGTLPVAAGGSGATTFTSNGLIYGNGTGAFQATAVGTTGQVLVGNTGAAPSWAALSSSAVTSISFGTTGLTPNTATQGAITVAGTLAVANGGTGLTSTPANGALDIGNGTGFTRTTLTQGSGITITNGSGSITIANAGVTSFSGGTTGLTPNSATTGAVTLAGTLAIANGGTGATTVSGAQTNLQVDPAGTALVYAIAMG